jgi:SSS family solute:Na+ symporter
MVGMLTKQDLIVIAAFCGLSFLVGLAYSWRKKTASEYFLAGRRMGWFAVGASLFIGAISTEQVLGISSAGYATGFAGAQAELIASLMALFLGWIVTPLLFKSEIFTGPEFFGQRYNSAVRSYISAISILTYLLVRLSIPLAAAALLLRGLAGVDVPAALMIIVGMAGVAALLGGMRAVIMTNVVQAGMFLFSLLTMARIARRNAGGIRTLLETTPHDLWQMFMPLSNGDFPWIGVILGAPILGIWLWCTDQYVVQKVLSTKTAASARRAAVFAGVAQAATIGILVIVGIYAQRLSGGNLTSEKVYAWFTTMFANPRERGVIIAGVLALLLSSFSGTFAATSSLLTMDFVKRWKPDASDTTLVRYGRVATLFVILACVTWVQYLPVLKGETVYSYLQFIQSCLAPPVAACFLIGLVWKNANSRGALAALTMGFSIGLIRLLVQGTSAGNPPESSLMHSLASSNYLYFTIALFVVCAATLVVVSQLSKTSKEILPSLSWRIIRTDLLGTGGTSRTVDLLVSIGFIAIFALSWLIFR